MAWPLLSGTQIMALGHSYYRLLDLSWIIGKIRHKDKIYIIKYPSIYIHCKPGKSIFGFRAVPIKASLFYIKFWRLEAWFSVSLCRIQSWYNLLIRCPGSNVWIWPGALIFEIWVITTNVLLSIYSQRQTQTGAGDKNKQGEPQSLIRHLLEPCFLRKAFWKCFVRWFPYCQAQVQVQVPGQVHVRSQVRAIRSKD
mgnify:CR=1 FL=1